MSAPPPSTKGRGARSNRSGRYEPEAREAFDDGWDEEDEPKPLRTELTAEAARKILSYNDSPDIGFDRSINPYRGCEHGCTYCYARPAHAYMGLSPGLDFESRIFYKPQAAELLERELSARGYAPKNIQIGGNTDPYQPIERELKITRSVLEVLQRYRHPFSIITKSALIERDLDILGEMGRAGLAKAAVSITTLDRRLARSMEPRAATPERRFHAVKALTEAGTPTIVMFAPVVPNLNDHELDAVLERAAESGAVSAGYVVLRLPLEISGMFQEWLETDHLGRAKHVMSLVRQMRGGKDYVSRWGERQKGDGPLATLLASRFAKACARYGLNQRGWLPTDVSQFRIPDRPGQQMSLFG